MKNSSYILMSIALLVVSFNSFAAEPQAPAPTPRELLPVTVTNYSTQVGNEEPVYFAPKPTSDDE